MKIIKKTVIGILSIGGLSVLIMGYDPSISLVKSNNLNVSSTPASQDEAIINENNDMQTFIDALSIKMKQKHAHEIHNVFVQLSMADFREFVLEEFPQDGESIFQQIMKNAFPHYADDILALLNNMRIYNDWHVDMLLTLNEMNALTRNGTLWDKRRALFGDLAEEIWQQELDDTESKQKTIQETLALLHKADDLSMADRLNILTDTIREQYSDEQDSALISKGMVADIYFHLDSVQSDLKNMDEQARSDALAQSRRQLGFSEEQVKQMAEADAKKESRWQNGYAYMSARDQLLGLYTGDELQKKLADLRVQYFSHEAPTIEKEEASDFFRYKRPRLYGSN